MKKNISLLIALFLSVVALSAQQVDTITIHSKMGHDLKNVIILPESYTNSDTRYPVVYLRRQLFGLAENKTRVAANRLPLQLHHRLPRWENQQLVLEQPP